MHELKVFRMHNDTPPEKNLVQPRALTHRQLHCGRDYIFALEKAVRLRRFD